MAMIMSLSMHFSGVPQPTPEKQVSTMKILRSTSIRGLRSKYGKYGTTEFKAESCAIAVSRTKVQSHQQGLTRIEMASGGIGLAALALKPVSQLPTKCRLAVVDKVLESLERIGAAVAGRGR